MKFDELFSLEEKIIRHGDKLLSMDSSANNLWRDEYADLLKHYKKMFKQLNRLIKINDRQQSKLSQANSILEMHSKHDELTKIHNRRMFNEMFEREWQRSIRYKHPMSLLIFDIDHFKQVNDEHGHQAGDEILKISASIIAQAAKRAGDLAARYGGEEFVLMLPDTNKMGGFKLAEDIRKNIAKNEVTYEGKVISVTISAGLATTIPDIKKGPDKLIKSADDALYMAKRTGRNRVCMADDIQKEETDHAG